MWILISLAQSSRHFVRVRSLSLWRGANFDIARATFSSLCVHRIALVVAWCEFWYHWSNLLFTLCVSDRSRCGAARLWTSHTKPSRHSVWVRSLSLWRGADFSCLSLSEIQVKKESYYIVLWKVLLWRSGKSFMVQSWRSVNEDLDQGLAEVLWADAVKILMKSCQRSLHDLVQVLVRRSCGDPVATLFERSLHEDLEDALNWCLYDSSSRMLMGSSCQDDLVRSSWKSFFDDLVKFSSMSWYEVLVWGPDD